MNTLRLLMVLTFLGVSTFMYAQHSDKNAPIFFQFTEMNEGDETSLSALMFEEQKVFIQWKSSTKGVYFEIEKSENGEDFEMIATSEDVVPTAGGTIFYYVDEQPSIENYYRIFYITPSGTVDYSEVTFVSPLPSNMTIDSLR